MSFVKWWPFSRPQYVQFGDIPNTEAAPSHYRCPTLISHVYICLIHMLNGRYFLAKSVNAIRMQFTMLGSTIDFTML